MSTRTAVCPGSFDPPTLGHVDIIGRTAALFDQVVVAVLVNESKTGRFPVPDRLAMLRDAVAAYPNVTVESFSGLLVDLCRAHDAAAIVKGVRGPADVEYELAMAHMNRHLTGVETLLVPARPEWTFVSSGLVTEVARLGGDVSGLVPSEVQARLDDVSAVAATDSPEQSDSGD